MAGGSRVMGELSERIECESFIFKEITCNFGDVLSLGRFGGGEVSSLDFSFAGGTWELCMDAFYAFDFNADWVYIRLRRLHSLEAEQDVYFRMHLKTNRGIELGDSVSCDRFSNDNEYDNYYDYERPCIILPEIDDRLRDIAPDDELVVICRMYTKKTDGQSAPEEELVTPLASELSERNECRDIITKCISWKIPDFSSFLLDTETVRSPEFSFENGTWILSLKHTRSIDGKDLGIHLTLRPQSEEAEHYVYFKCTLKTNNGHTLEDFISCYNFTFSEAECVRHDSYISDAKYTLDKAPDDTLIVVCQMHSSRTTTECTSQVKGVAVGESSEIKVVQQIAENLSPTTSYTKLHRDFEKLLLTENFCDVTLHVREQNFRSHRAILGAGSPVFASILSHDMKEKNTRVIDIEDCDPQTFPDFLRFLYYGNVESITCENVCSLYRAADKYDVPDLESECLTFMRRHLDVDNFCDVMSLALMHNEDGLVNQATGFFIENVAKIIRTVKWQKFLTENPIEGNELFIKSLPVDKC